MANDNKRLAYRIAEAGEAIGVSRAKAYEMVASGEIPSVLIGGVRRVPVEALEAKFQVKQKDG